LAFILMLSIAITDLCCLSAYFANLFCYLFGLRLFEAIGKVFNIKIINNINLFD